MSFQGLRELDSIFVPLTRSEKVALREELEKSSLSCHVWSRGPDHRNWRLIEAPDRAFMLIGKGGFTVALVHDSDEAIAHFVAREIKSRSLRPEAFDFQRGGHMMLRMTEGLSTTERKEYVGGTKNGST